MRLRLFASGLFSLGRRPACSVGMTLKKPDGKVGPVTQYFVKCSQHSVASLLYRILPFHKVCITMMTILFNIISSNCIFRKEKVVGVSVGKKCPGCLFSVETLCRKKSPARRSAWLSILKAVQLSQPST